MATSVSPYVSPLMSHYASSPLLEVLDGVSAPQDPPNVPICVPTSTGRGNGVSAPLDPPGIRTDGVSALQDHPSVPICVPTSVGHGNGVSAPQNPSNVPIRILTPQHPTDVPIRVPTSTGCGNGVSAPLDPPVSPWMGSVPYRTLTMSPYVSPSLLDAVMGSAPYRTPTVSPYVSLLMGSVPAVPSHDPICVLTPQGPTNVPISQCPICVLTSTGCSDWVGPPQCPRMCPH